MSAIVEGFGTLGKKAIGVEFTSKRSFLGLTIGCNDSHHIRFDSLLDLLEIFCNEAI